MGLATPHLASSTNIIKCNSCDICSWTVLDIAINQWCVYRRQNVSQRIRPCFKQFRLIFAAALGSLDDECSLLHREADPKSRYNCGDCLPGFRLVDHYCVPSKSQSNYVDWLSDWVTEQLTERLSDRLTGRHTDWIAEWITESLINLFIAVLFVLECLTDEECLASRRQPCDITSPADGCGPCTDGNLEIESVCVTEKGEGPFPPSYLPKSYFFNLS